MLNVYEMTNGTHTVHVVMSSKVVSIATGYAKSDLLEDEVSAVKAFVSAALAKAKSKFSSEPDVRKEPHAVNQHLVNQYNDAVRRSLDPRGYKNLELFQIRKLGIRCVRRASLREHAQYWVLVIANYPGALTVPVRVAP